MNNSLVSLLDFTRETAYLAGRLTLAHYQTGLVPDIKTDGTVVTQADRGAEELVRKRIETKFPGDAIVGEEFGEKGSQGSSRRWIIDPIDGTYSFVHGVPLYAVLIGLEIEGKIEVGAAYFPALDEMISAASGLGCYWNNLRCQVSEKASLSEGLVLCNDPQDMEKAAKTAAWERIRDRAAKRRGWGDAYGYLLVATGRAEIMLDPRMNVWDCGPFPVILREAGGYFGDWQGKGSIYEGEALGTTQKLLPEVLELIRGN